MGGGFTLESQLTTQRQHKNRTNIKWKLENWRFNNTFM